MSRDGSLPFGCRDLAELQKPARVIGKDGRQLGIMNLSDAIKIAESEAAELVKISQTTSPMVYRMVDCNQYKELVEKRKHSDSE